MYILKSVISLFVIVVSITLIDLAIEAISAGNTLGAGMPLLIAIIGLTCVLCVALSCLLVPSHNPSISTRA